MRKPSYRVVDGTEAIASVAYRLNDLILIDPALPSAYFQDGLGTWVREKRRNLRDRIPEITTLPDGAWSPSLFASDTRKTILTVTERLPSLLATIKELSREQRPQSILVASEKGSVLNSEVGEEALISGSIQEAADFCILASMATGPIIHLFDIDRLSREIQKIDCLSDDDLRTLVGKNKDDLSVAFRRFAEATGRSYQPFDYEGNPEAEKVVVSMGPESGTIRDAIRLIHSKSRQERIGLVTVRQLSPWDRKGLVEKIPGSVQTVFVPDRADLHFKVMDALHEGLVNRWSWFATLPKLTCLKDTHSVARQIFSEVPQDDRSMEFRLDVTKPDGTLPLLRLALGLLGESLFVQAFLSKDSAIHLRFSPDPILSNEETTHPLSLPVLDTRGIAESIGPEALPATVLVTSILKLVLKTGEGMEKWKSLLGEYLRPLGTFFVLQNLAAVDRTFKILEEDAVAEQPVVESPDNFRPNLSAPNVPNLKLRSRTVPILNEFPDDLQKLNTVGEAGAFLLPLIRETDLRKTALKYFAEFSQNLLPQNFRSPPSDRSLGLKPFLEKIAALRSATKLPLIARLSAQIIESWVSFGVEFQECGVDALEIVFEEAPWEKALQNRDETVRRLKQAIRIPVFVSLSPFDSDIPAQVERLKDSGADAIVLFHEPETSHRLHTLGWISQLSQKTAIPLIAHGGFNTPDEVTKALQAGATWVQTETNEKFSNEDRRSK